MRVNFIFGVVKILVTAATEVEMAPLNTMVKNFTFKKKPDFAVTGIGMTATAYYLAKKISMNAYDLAINIGVAGSFKKAVSIGEVVYVKSDGFADLGAEDGTAFLTLSEMGLQKKKCISVSQ
jgi:futalosine hydrolase